MLRKIILLLLVGILVNCSEDRELSPRPFARVETLAVDKITPGSATFSAEITLANVSIKDHGFLLSRYKDFTGSMAEKFSLGERTGPGTFEMIINTEMEQGKTYFVKAFVSTEGYTSYGSIQEFVSLGSEAPVLESISLTEGTWNDLVILRGKNFSKDFRKNKVTFSTFDAPVYSSSSDTIVCRVPMGLNSSPASVEVSVLGNVSQIEDAFSLLKPEITAISPLTATAPELVTITGKHFNVSTLRLTVGGLPVTPESVTATTVAFRVAQQLAHGVNEVRLYNAEGNGFATVDLEVYGPKVVDIQPLSGTYGDELTITVDDWPAQEVTTVYIGDVQAPVTSFEGNNIKVTVPEVMAVENEIVLYSGSVSVPSGILFNLLPPEISSVSPNSMVSGELAITGKGFSVSHTQVHVDGSLAQITHYDRNLLLVEIQELSSHESMIEVTSSGHYLKVNVPLVSPLIVYSGWPSPFDPFKPMTIGDEIYSMAFWNGHVSFSYFNRSSRSWVFINEPPFSPNDFDVNFFIGQTLYYYAADERTFWAYNASGSDWMNLSTPPFDLWYAHGFSDDTYGYVIGGRDRLSWEDSGGVVWQYNPDNDSWTEKQSAQLALRDIDDFASNGKFSFFTGDGHLAQYIPASDQWDISSEQFDLNALRFIAPVGNDILFSTFYEGKLMKYSLATSQYSEYENLYMPGPGYFYHRIPNISKTYFLDSSGRMWELDPDYL